MTWPAPPDDRAGTQGPAEPPWTPRPTADRGPTSSRGRRSPLPLVGVGLGVVALAVAGWLAVSQGLVPGLGGAASASEGASMPDIHDEPEEAWTYSYLPRNGDVESLSLRVHDDLLLSLTGPSTDIAEVDAEDLAPGEDYVLSALDLRTGTERWTTELGVPAGDPDYRYEPSVIGVAGDRLVLTTTSDPTGMDAGPELEHYLFLDLQDGATVESLEDERTFHAPGAGMLLATVADEVQRLDPLDTEAAPLWTTVVGGSAWGVSQDGPTLEVHTEEGILRLDPETGEEPSWFDGPAEGVSYHFDDGAVFREESGENGSYLDRLGPEGDTLWSADADRFFVMRAATRGLVILAGDGTREEEHTTYRYLRRLDPRTGDDLWDVEVEGGFDWAWGPSATTVTMSDWERGRESLVALDDGERVARLRSAVTRLGEDTVYSLEDGRLRAFDVSGTELWTVRARGATALFDAPGHLITHDDEAGRLTKWE